MELFRQLSRIYWNLTASRRTASTSTFSTCHEPMLDGVAELLLAKPSLLQSIVQVMNNSQASSSTKNKLKIIIMIIIKSPHQWLPSYTIVSDHKIHRFIRHFETIPFVVEMMIYLSLWRISLSDFFGVMSVISPAPALTPSPFSSSLRSASVSSAVDTVDLVVFSMTET